MQCPLQNTFQAILITDGTSSFSIFTYKCGLLGWDNGVTIGYNAAGDPYDNYDPSSSDIACENDPGSVWNNVLYILSENDPRLAIGKAFTSEISILILCYYSQCNCIRCWDINHGIVLECYIHSRGA